MNPAVGLVLEGGGMRGAYTAGVLDAFMDQDIEVPYVIGVSAGANAGADYVVAQRERNHRMFVELVADPRYAGWRNVFRERSWFGMKFLFETAPDEVAPFDYGALRDSPRTLIVGTTDCVTGLPVYFSSRDYDPRWFIHTVHRASCSIPLISPPVEIGSRLYLDGGVSDPIPTEKSMSDGNTRNVVVLTRNAGYRKTRGPWGYAADLMLARYPGIRQANSRRADVYNSSLDRLTELEKAAKAFVIRPIKPLVVGRMERDVGKLNSLYRQGYEEAVERVPALRSWLSHEVTA